jgi:SAM-dependent methyltransferase
MAAIVGSWIAALRCPREGSSLVHRETGWLTCPACAQRYGFGRGIASFLSASYVAPPTASLEGLSELEACEAALNPQRDDVVVVLGSGDGLLARRLLPRVARLVAVDASLDNLVSLFEHIPPPLRQRALLVHADPAAPLPLARGLFTKVVSLDLFERVDHDESRRRVTSNVSELLRTGGRFVTTVQNRSTVDRVRDLAVNELSALIEGAGMRIEFVRGLRFDGLVTRMLEHFAAPVRRLRAQRISGQRGSLLLARARIANAG